jgi:hypothetical protein
MLTTRHAVDCAYTRPELEALFREARAQDVERGGRCDARGGDQRVVTLLATPGDEGSVRDDR